MHIHGPTLLQTERHKYLKSTFSVSVMSVETFAITLWKAGSLRGEIITFLSFKSNKHFHLQDIKKKGEQQGKEGKGAPCGLLSCPRGGSLDMRKGSKGRKSSKKCRPEQHRVLKYLNL